MFDCMDFVHIFDFICDSTVFNVYFSICDIICDSIVFNVYIICAMYDFIDFNAPV